MKPTTPFKKSRSTNNNSTPKRGYSTPENRENSPSFRKSTPQYRKFTPSYSSKGAPTPSLKKRVKRILKPGNMLNPTPVVLVSCGSSIEEYNIITIAWTGTICSDPPLCYISVRPERHSYDIIKRNGCFVINLVNDELVAKADWAGVKSGSKFNKFIQTDLTPVKAQKVAAPLIAESPINIECLVKEILPLGTHDMFIAEVVSVSVDDALFDKKNNAIELKRANLVAFSHGQYFGLGKILGKFGYSVQKKC